MAILTDSQLYQFFETGDVPTQQQFRDLIDSKVNVLNISTLDLEVGVTQIDSGITQGILFQNGTTLSQDSNFLYDFTNDRLGIGGTPISRLHIESSTANSDSSSIGITFKRTDTPNTNTTASAIRSANSSDVLLTNFGTFYESGGGQRFSVVLSTSNSVAGTEKMRLSKLGRLSIGANMLDGAMVDIQAAGTLSTDIAFRVRNSANTRDLLNIRGNRTIEMIADTPSSNGGISISADAYNSPTINFYDAFGTNMLRIDTPNRLIGFTGNANIQIGSLTTSGYLGMVTPSSSNRFLKLVDAFSNEYLSIGGSTFDGSGGISMTLKTTTNNGTNFVTFSRNNNTNQFVISDQANVGIGGTTFGTSSKFVISQFTGTAPSTSPADAYQQYSADITAGNAAPHFRTENGNIIKIYQETTGVAAATLVSGSGGSAKHDDTYDGYTISQVVKALRNQGLLA